MVRKVKLCTIQRLLCNELMMDYVLFVGLNQRSKIGEPARNVVPNTNIVILNDINELEGLSSSIMEGNANAVVRQS